MTTLENQALAFIRRGLDKYGKNKVAALSSFGKDSIVLLHLVKQVEPTLPIIWIKPPFLPKETIELTESLTKEWNLNLMVAESDKMRDKKFMENIVLNPDLPKTNPELCCQIFKVAPAMNIVKRLNLKAWFSGLRATESDERSYFTPEYVQGNFTKLHPILDWTEADIWGYIATHNLPVHPYYKKGYRSIGCKQCSSPSQPNESERDSRWRGTRMCGGGCGLHRHPMR